MAMDSSNMNLPLPTVLDTQQIYNGKIIQVRKDTILEQNRQATREVVQHCEASCILPVDSDGNVYIERQYRHGVGRFVVELPAGKVDEGERPEACAVRELAEEIGAVCSDLIYFGPMLVSPAYCSEIIHLYAAKIDAFLPPHPDDGEFIEVEKIPFTGLLQLIDEQQITDAKTVMLALKYARAVAAGQGFDVSVKS